MELSTLPWEERLNLGLGRLFEQHGYSKYRMGKFEEYGLYMENKNFLKSAGIITFTDMDGRLMALKPDVTLSIVKNAQPGTVEKLYYMENVYRLAREGHEYREIGQMGLEFIGGEDAQCEAEVLLLALKSLEAISESYVLDVSHMGLVSALLEQFQVPESHQEPMLSALSQKNRHELRQRALAAGLTQQNADRLCGLTALPVDFPQALEKARAAFQSPATAPLFDRLAELYAALAQLGYGSHLRLDFSIVNDLTYYNGLIFQGYVKEVPRAVLAGGRYDNLLHRFGKPQGAIGFALYLDEVGRAFHEHPPYDVDTLLMYETTQPVTLVLKAVEQLAAQGGRVRAACEKPEGLRWRRAVRIADNGELIPVKEEAE